MNIMAPSISTEISVSVDALTASLVGQSRATRFDRLPDDLVTITEQCMLDYIGVALAGASEPASEIIYAELAEQGGAGKAHVIGRGSARLPAVSAALANGTAAHALDYDDVNLAMLGHPSVAILPGLLALGEELHASGPDIITAFVAGYELQCRLGRLLAPSHYDNGFHSTGTLGTFGAAAACARLMELDAVQTAHALGIAGTQAAGLKSMFGTMCKPLHAGKAAANGLLAARMARRGFDSRPDILEIAQGFSATHSPDYNPSEALAIPAGGAHLIANLFKYHAACYLTHATIEATRRLRLEHGLLAENIRAVHLRLDRSCDRVCNILEPRTGLETKFSLRHCCAMALAGVDTAALSSYSDAGANDPALAALRQKINVDFVSGWPNSITEVEIILVDGCSVSARHDSGVAATDLIDQGRRLNFKFHALTSPILGNDKARRIAASIGQIHMHDDISELVRACA